MVRYKHRYIVTEINQSRGSDVDTLSLRDTSLYAAIMKKVQQLHGDFGEGALRSGFHAKYCNPNTRTAILRCRLGPHKLVASALPFITQIDHKSVKVDTLYTGATIKQCLKFLKDYQQIRFDKVCGRLRSVREREDLQKAILNFDSTLAM